LGKKRTGRLKEKVWRDRDGQVVKYSLAYINPAVRGADNGRVLGYDNSHDHHHRRFREKQERR
jgi:CHASE1-domain containing sensor protein